MTFEQCKEICSGGWPRNQREQARFDAEQWLISEVERLTKPGILVVSNMLYCENCCAHKEHDIRGADICCVDCDSIVTTQIEDFEDAAIQGSKKP